MGLVDYENREGHCIPDRVVKPCPSTEYSSYLGPWSDWSACLTKCGGRGVKIRTRDCAGDRNCTRDSEQREECPGFCPPSESIASITTFFNMSE